MPSTPSIHRRCISLDYKILISPKKEKTPESSVYFVCLAIILYHTQTIKSIAFVIIKPKITFLTK